MAAIALYEWLQGERDYQKGLELYLKHGKNNFLKSVFSLGESSYNREKLISEIENIAKQPNSNPSPPPEINTGELKVKYPPEVQALVEQRIQLYKESSHLQSTLRLIPDQEKRRLASAKILDNFDLIDELWEKVSYYEINGVLPPEVRKSNTLQYEKDPVQMISRIRTLRTYISRDKNNPKKAEKVEAWKQEMAFYEKELGS